MIDVGGTHVKLLVSGKRAHREFESGPGMTPPQMVAGVKELTRDWASDVVAIGFPGPVRRGRPAREPWHLGPGWTRFDFRRAFGKPVRLVNDAAMQALGSYGGGRMLFLGLGTGLGSALVNRGVLEPLELAHLPYRNGRTFDDDLGQLGLERLGKRRWRKAVEEVVGMLRDALQADYVVLGGGNVRHVKRLPGSTRRGSNANAFRGGFLLWKDA